jgi:hypothetical protein
MSSKSNKPSMNRRAVLRGSLAAPVVLTVSSPAAAVTSLQRCLANAAAQGADPFISSGADTWLRTSVAVHKLEKDNGGGNDKQSATGTNDKQSTDWVYFDEGLQDFVTVSTPNTRLGIGPLMKGWKKTASETRLALVWVDEKNGTPYSKLQIQRPAGYTACTHSCYTSFT